MMPGQTSTTIKVQQQHQRHQQEHCTTRKGRSVDSNKRQQLQENEKDTNLNRTTKNCELISAHTKVDQWLLQHFKVNASDLHTTSSGATTTQTISCSSLSSCRPSITTLHIPTPKLPGLKTAANVAAILVPKLARPITTTHLDYDKSPPHNVKGNNFKASLITTNSEHKEHSQLQPKGQTTIPPTNIYHYQTPQQNQTALASNRPFISSYKMDADFWQQARGAPFGLHTALATNNMSHHVQVPHMPHLQHHHHQPPQLPPSHHLTEQMPTTQVHMNQNIANISQGDTTATTEQQQQQLHHQPHHHTNQQQQHLHHHPHHHLHDEQQQLHHQHTHLGNEQSHHLLFNAAAAAAAAAHLSGVAKSNELSNTSAANDDDKIAINNNNSSNNNNNNNNNSDHNEQNVVSKQEPRVTNSLNAYVGTNTTNSSNTNNNNNHTHSQQIAVEQHQQQAQLHHQQNHKQQQQQQQQQQHSLKFEQGAVSPGSLPLEALQHQIQQQMQQQQQHTKDSLTVLNSNENHKPDNQQQHHHQHHVHNIHAQHQQPQTINSIDNKSAHCDQQQVTTTCSQALAPTSPLRISSLAHHQTPTSSPQPSLTSPSAGSSTPDLKFSSDNNKLPNELQLQLSRSNSAAAISERTLEECWSTLQRLFMHKSAMQQMQQQIPRTGLGPAVGAGGIGAESKPHQCQQCMKSFSSNHQLVQHIRVHTGEKPYKCSYCDRRFKQLSHVQQHTRLHTGERPYKCHLPECGRAFIQLSNLQQHLRNHDAQVERAKNRPFHCNICGKGFATESSLRTHTSKELQLHLGVLQQHAALIGGPNATSCPICHKLFLGTDALMEHMKHVHKEKNSQSNNNPFVESICGSAGNNLSNAGSSSCLQSSGASSSNDPYSAKRRTANHPCPVCGKHYVNEGSLRKHLACHAETSQLTNSLRMWPCSVCQAVFTYENGLLTHMEHMRMDPKHQFAAQYVLSRAAAERRDRDNILAATLAASSGSSGAGLIPLLGEGSGVGGGGSNSLCPSPSANSECSSNGRLSSSAASDPGSGINLLSSSNNNNNTNNNNNNNISHVNNTGNSSNSNLSLSNKLNDILRTGSNTNHQLCVPPHPHTHVHNPNQNHSHTLPSHNYSGMPGVDADLQNRMSLMAAASAAAAAVAASANSSSVTGLPSPQRFGVESTHAAGNAAVQAAVVNLAAAMRLNHTTATGSPTAGAGTANDNSMDANLQQTQSNGAQNHLNSKTMSPVHHPGLQAETSTAVMNAMRDSMMRTTMMETSVQEADHHHQQLQQQQSTGHSSYTHTSNTNMSQHTNHHHIQQHQQQQSAQHLPHLQQNSTASSGGGALQHLHQQHNHTTNNQLQATITPPPSHLPETALHMQQQAEAILRSHTEAAFRMAASVVQQQSNEITNNNNNTNDKHEQAQQQQQQHTKNTLTEENSQQKVHLSQNSQDISEVIRLQEHRLEQALRLHNDGRTFNFLNPSATQQQHQQQPNNPTNHTNSNTSNTTKPTQQHHHTT